MHPEARLLHVGVGSSALARRFAARVAHIDGVTVVADERAVGRALGLANYRVRLLNKYGDGLRALVGPYTFIIDNNPWTYACCRRHARQMLATCAELLASGGMLLTDARGAGWPPRGGEGLSVATWAAEVERVGLRAEALTDTVWVGRRA